METGIGVTLLTSLSKLIEDIACTLRACPDIVALLDVNLDAIQPYQDIATSDRNSVTRRVYTQPNGTILIVWQTSGIAEGEMETWAHQIDLFVRALRQESPLRLLNAILDATPEGQTERWRYLCVNDDVMPMEIQEIARITDEESVDYYVIRALFREKGDFDGLSS